MLLSHKVSKLDTPMIMSILLIVSYCVLL